MSKSSTSIGLSEFVASDPEAWAGSGLYCPSFLLPCRVATLVGFRFSGVAGSLSSFDIREGVRCGIAEAVRDGAPVIPEYIEIDLVDVADDAVRDGARPSAVQYIFADWITHIQDECFVHESQIRGKKSD